MIVFPAGRFSAAVIFDIPYLILQNRNLSTVSFYMIASGVVGGLLAAIFAFIDWLGSPKDSRARNIGNWHGLENLVIVLLFAGSWFIRGNNANFVPNAPALILSFIGIGRALITLWICGELVYRLGVGVDRGANVNTPHSLAEASASATGSKRTVSR